LAVARPQRRSGKKKPKRRSSERIIGEALAHLIVLWRELLRRPRRRALLAALVLVFVAAMLVARVGTARTRVASGAILAGAFVVAGVVMVRERRRWRDPRLVIHELAGRADPERAGRALRALSLLDEDGEPKDSSTSPVLARLHVARQLAALPQDRIAEEAGRAARRTNVLAGVVAVVALVVGGTHAFSVVEGADVLCASAGVAPLGLPYVADLALTARPPDYLHMEETRRAVYGHVSVPRGTLLTFRGEPVHAGRRLVITDGKNEVPFVDDGGGKVVARWPMAESATLRIVARFGDVVVQEPDATEVTSIADQPPAVTLEGAPKTIALASPEGAVDIPIRYEATDDHGLREVHLVLRSGMREERRVLAKLDGETRSDRGGAALRPSDPFVRRSHAPVDVHVEAEDNDPITGPKWGVSPSITLLPPDVGEAEARRLDAFRQLRDAYVDALAWRMGHPVPAGAVRAFLDEEDATAKDLAARVDRTLLTAYGVKLAPRLAAFLRGQQHRVDDAMAAEKRGPTAASHASLVKATGTMVLVIDGAVRGLGQKDAKAAGRSLAESAEDLARGFEQRQLGANANAKPAIQAALHVLRGGEKQLPRLGPLGRDLGGAITAALGRVDRAVGQGDNPHAALAARDLAARLQTSDPSFDSKGGSGGAGGEGGGSGAAMDRDQGPSEAERAFDEAVQDLEQLSDDHASEVGKVDQSLSKGLGDDELKALRDASKPHAEAVRKAVADLPSVGGGSDTWTSKGASARELAEQMARSLEQGDPSDAVQSGRQALQTLDEAKRMAARERFRSWDEPTSDDAEKKVDDAKKKLEPEVKWAEEQLDAARKRAAERAAGDLRKSGDEEGRLADRAKQLADRSRDKGSLPQGAVDALDDAAHSARQAADALQRGDADRATEQLKDAQHKLEAAKQALGDESEDAGEAGDSGDGGEPSKGHADIPTPDAHKSPEQFRKRVLQGLAQPSSGKQKDAIVRYAEGLLR
jgi:hypothetical protein